MATQLPPIDGRQPRSVFKSSTSAGSCPCIARAELKPTANSSAPLLPAVGTRSARKHSKPSPTEVIREGRLLPSKDSWSLCFDRNLTLKIHLKLDGTDQNVKNRADASVSKRSGLEPQSKSYTNKVLASDNFCDKSVVTESPLPDGPSKDCLHSYPMVAQKSVADFRATPWYLKPSTGTWLCQACPQRQVAPVEGVEGKHVIPLPHVLKGGRLQASRDSWALTMDTKLSLRIHLSLDSPRPLHAPLATEAEVALATGKQSSSPFCTDAVNRKQFQEKAADACKGAWNTKPSVGTWYAHGIEHLFQQKSSNREAAKEPSSEIQCLSCVSYGLTKQIAQVSELEITECCGVEVSETRPWQLQPSIGSWLHTASAPRVLQWASMSQSCKRPLRQSQFSSIGPVSQTAQSSRILREAFRANAEMQQHDPNATSMELWYTRPSVGTWLNIGRTYETLHETHSGHTTATQTQVQQERHEHAVHLCRMYPSVGTWLNTTRSYPICHQAQKTVESIQQKRLQQQRHQQQQEEIISAIQQHHHASRLELWQVQPSIGASVITCREYNVLQKAREMLAQMQLSASSAAPQQSTTASQNFIDTPQSTNACIMDRHWNLRPSIGTWYHGHKIQRRPQTLERPSWQHQPSIATWLSAGREFVILSNAAQASAEVLALPIKQTPPENEALDRTTVKLLEPQSGRAASAPSSLFGSWSQKHARSVQQHLRSVAHMVLSSQAFLNRTAPAGFWNPPHNELPFRHRPSVGSWMSKRHYPPRERPNDLDLLALHFAAVNGDISEVQLLLGMRANPNATDEHNIVPMHLAVDGDHEEIVALLITARAAINAPTVGGSPDTHAVTPLHAAANRGTVPIAIRLLAARASPDSARGDLVTPLHFVAQGGHLDMLHVLLAANASVSVTSTGGFTALHDASLGGHADIVSVLLSRRALPNVENDSGTNPLHVAAQCGHMTVMTHLLAHGACPSPASVGGFTPLHDAAHAGHLLAVSQLLLSRAVVDATSIDGATALHLAAQAGHADVVLELLSAGACVDVPPGKGMLSPVHLAAKGGHIHIVRMLRKANRLSKDMHRQGLHVHRDWSRDRRGNGSNRAGARSRSRSSSNSRCCGPRSSRALSDVSQSMSQMPFSRSCSGLELLDRRRNL